MSEFEPGDFQWIAGALDHLRSADYGPDHVEVDNVNGRVKFVYEPAQWGDDDE